METISGGKYISHLDIPDKSFMVVTVVTSENKVYVEDQDGQLHIFDLDDVYLTK